MLRPDALKARTRACPVAYIPLGVLEWHGVHNPMGADALQAEGIAVACAQAGGGVVFPPLYYGLFQDRMETIERFQRPILEYMDWDKSRFEPAGRLDRSYEERERYVHLLMNILYEAEAMGFALGVFVAGHYPLIDHARAAVLEFTDQRKFESRPVMQAWAFADYLLVEPQYPKPGDHGACWETSHLLYLRPETVDMSLLPQGQEVPIGVLVSDRPPQAATAAFGKEIIDAAVKAALREVQERLENPDYYRNHGRCLEEQVWRRRVR
jgi:creatinine amidohydrolase